MIKINKYLTTFLGIGAFFSLLFSISIEKFFPVLTQQTISYCTQFTQSIAIPHILTRLPLLFFLVLIAIGVIKFAFILYKTYVTKHTLEKKITVNHRIHAITKEIGIEGKVKLIENDKIFAFCFGLASPKIYISTSMIKVMNISEVKAILLHEKYHLDNRDSLIMVVVQIIQTIFPFFPILSDVFSNYLIEREINADMYASKVLGEKNSLISVMKKLLYVPQISLAFAPAIAERLSLEPRINALVESKTSYKSYKKFNILISMLCFIVLSLILLAPVQAVELHTNKQDIMLICADTKQCYGACENKTVIPEQLKASSINHKSASFPFSSR